VGAYRVLDVGCGAGGYLKYAAERNPRLSGLGVEQDERAAALAHDCLQAWQLDGRISIQTANIEAISPGEDFDLAMLHLIVAYVAAEKRTEFLRHVRAFLKPGGTILISNQVRPAKPTGEDVQIEWLNLWGLMTYGGGPVPVEGEIEKSLSEAGYVSIAAKRLIPLTRFASITAKKPCSSD
jgi:cyclopropane fatty-acyl-phospholipid synthase-like methyltransferase